MEYVEKVGSGNYDKINEDLINQSQTVNKQLWIKKSFVFHCISSPAALHQYLPFTLSPILIPHRNPSPSQKQVRIQLSDIHEQQVGGPIRPAPTQT